MIVVYGARNVANFWCVSAASGENIGACNDARLAATASLHPQPQHVNSGSGTEEEGDEVNVVSRTNADNLTRAFA